MKRCQWESSKDSDYANEAQGAQGAYLRCGPSCHIASKHTAAAEKEEERKKKRQATLAAALKRRQLVKGEEEPRLDAEQIHTNRPERLHFL